MSTRNAAGAGNNPAIRGMAAAISHLVVIEKD
jgi:ribosomal protein L30/L7E